MKTKIIKFLKLVTCLLIIILFMINWMYLSPDKKQWIDTIYQKFPVVKYKVNPTMIGFNTGDKSLVIDAIRSAGNLWSFQNGESHFQLSYNGTTESPPAGYDQMGCTEEAKKAMREMDNIVYASNSEDSDCSGQACTYIWSCEGSNSGNSPSEILHFDMEINAKEYEWDTGTNHKKSYNLFTIIAKQFGQLLGLGHCAPGDSEAACQQIVAVQGTSNPTSDSLLYKFIEPEVIRTGMSADDKAGLQSLYGTLNTDEKDLNDFMKQFKQKADSSCNPYPCVIPQNETDSRYILRADEITALQRHKQQMQASGLDSIPERLDKFKFIQKDYFTAFSVNGISAEDYLNESIDLMQDYIQDTPTELLIPSILDLSVTLDNRNRAITEHRNELDIQYLRFLEIELKVLIQIRRSMLDEIPKR